MKCSLVKNVRLKDFVKYQYLTVKTHVIVPTYIILCYLRIIQKYYFTILRCVTCSKFCFKSYKSKSCLTLKFNHYSNSLFLLTNLVHPYRRLMIITLNFLFFHPIFLRYRDGNRVLFKVVIFFHQQFTPNFLKKF